MTTYIATIKRLADSEIICQLTHSSIDKAAVFLFQELQRQRWTGNLGVTTTKLSTGQAVIHDGFEYVITERFEIRAREHATHRGRLEEALRYVGLPVESYGVMGDRGTILEVGGDGFKIYFAFSRDGEFHNYSIGPVGRF